MSDGSGWTSIYSCLPPALVPERSILALSPGIIVDAVFVVLVLIALFSGWRQGAFAAVLSALGVAAGLVCSVAIAPHLVQLTDSSALRFILALALMFLLVGLGNLVGGLLGARLRDRIRWRGSLIIDSLIGSLFHAMATVLVAWLVAIPIATNVGGSVSQGLKHSHALGFVDKHTPEIIAHVPSKMAALLNESGLPPLVSPFSEARAREVAAPNIKVEDTALVERLRPAVVHVMGESQQCSRRLMGSGFAVDDNHVVTNAHVVAGTNSVRLDTVAGVQDAVVVYYNPSLDIAVLRSEHLGLSTLAWATEDARSGDDAIVMGFPQSGPFEAAPARVADKFSIAGPNIYATGRVERESYSVRGNIRQGNSGGPLVNTNGEVLGVVFGASVDKTDIGYALTAREVTSAIGDLTQLSEGVDTGECVNN